MAEGESRARRTNGIVSAVLVAFFLLHGALGSAALAFGFFGSLAWIVWAGMALVGVHVILSVITSREQLSDEQHPPSPRKKRHLALKWGTGAALAACIAAHVLFKGGLFGHIAVVALAIALAVHLCVGAKSLLKDIGVDRRFKLAFRVIACAFAALFVTAAIAGVIQGG